MGPDSRFSYDAFVSYSRQADSEFAQALVGSTRSYFGFRRRERLRIFRDTESLTPASGLTAELERNLAESRYLVLLASPGAATSPYVRAEVAWWLANRDVAGLVLMLTNGTIQRDGRGSGVDADSSTAIPPLLTDAYPDAPLYIDCRALRASGSGWTLRHAAFAEKVAELVAVLSGQTKDQVRGQRLDTLRRESELLATRLLDNPPEDPELYILLAIEALVSFAPSARAVLALNDAIWASGLRNCYFGHEGPVTACRYLADGQRFITGSADSTARLWAVGTREVLATFEHDAPVLDVAVSSDESFLATALADGSAHVWNLNSGHHSCVLTGHQRAISSIAFSPDNRHVVTASEDRTARVWEAAAGQLLHTLHKRNREPRCGVFSPTDSSVVVTVAWGFRLLLWDATRGTVKRKLWGAFGPAVDVSPDGTRIVAPSDNKIRVWDLRKRTKRAAVELEGHSENVASVAFGSDGATIVSAADKTVRVWRTDGAAEPQTLPVLQGVADARLSSEGTFVLTACHDSTARLWELRPRQENVRIGPVEHMVIASVSWDGMFVTRAPAQPFVLWDISGRKVGSLGADADYLHSAAFARESAVVATTGPGSTVSLWDSSDASLLDSWLCQQGAISGLDFSVDGTQLLTAGEDGTVGIWTVGRGQREGLVDGLPGKVKSVLWSPRGDRFATVHASSAGEFFPSGAGVFDADDHSVVRMLDEHQDAVTAAVFSPDGAQLATASWDGHLRIYDAASGALVLSVDHGHRVEDIAYSPDGNVLASTTQFSADIYLWEPTTGDPILQLTHSQWVSKPCFSSDGTALLVPSRDIAYVWDLQETELTNVLRGHQGNLRTGRFTADDRYIVTAADDGTIRIWDNLTLDELMAFARTRTFRDLTSDERRLYGLAAKDEMQDQAPDTARTHEAAPAAVTRAAFPLRGR